MDTLRSIAHLQREIGDKLFEILASSDNTVAIRNLLRNFVRETKLPRTLALGDREYEILDFFEENEDRMIGEKMHILSGKKNASSEEDDGTHLLKHQNEIPEIMRGNITFVFANWENDSGNKKFDLNLWLAGFVSWTHQIYGDLIPDQWTVSFSSLRANYGRECRLLRRIK